MLILFNFFSSHVNSAYYKDLERWTAQCTNNVNSYKFKKISLFLLFLILKFICHPKISPKERIEREWDKEIYRWEVRQRHKEEVRKEGKRNTKSDTTFPDTTCTWNYIHQGADRERERDKEIYRWEVRERHREEGMKEGEIRPSLIQPVAEAISP